MPQTLTKQSWHDTQTAPDGALHSCQAVLTQGCGPNRLRSLLSAFLIQGLIALSLQGLAHPHIHIMAFGFEDEAQIYNEQMLDRTLWQQQKIRLLTFQRGPTRTRH